MHYQPFMILHTDSHWLIILRQSTHTHQQDPFAIMRIDFFALRQRVSCKKGRRRRRNHLIEMLYCLQPFTTTAFHMCFGCFRSESLLQRCLFIVATASSVVLFEIFHSTELMHELHRTKTAKRSRFSALFFLVIVFNTEHPMPFPIIVTSVTTITTYTYTQIAFVYHRTQC